MENCEKKLLEESRQSAEIAISNKLTEIFDLRDVMPDELLEPKTDEATQAVEILYREIKMAMIYAAVSSALKSYWK